MDPIAGTGVADGAAGPGAMETSVKSSLLHAKYFEAVDRESAREKLAAKLEAGAAKAEAEVAEKKVKKSPSRPRQQEEGGIVSDVVKSAAFKDLMRTAAREIVRGVFKTGRR